MPGETMPYPADLADFSHLGFYAPEHILRAELNGVRAELAALEQLAVWLLERVEGLLALILGFKETAPVIANLFQIGF